MNEIVTRTVRVKLNKCHVCGELTRFRCEKTPSGGWGMIKCGRPTCKKCKCDCDEISTY